MANDDFFENFLRNSSNYNGGLEYYEDTHDAYGNYIGSRPAQQAPGAQYTQPSGYTAPVQPQRPEQNAFSQPQQQQPQQPPQPAAPVNTVQQPKAKPLPTAAQHSFALTNQYSQNFVLYSPRTTVDVEQLIAYLRRGEPALVDLDPISESPDAQRLMDFTSGAAYALGDRVITVRRNLFLITPDTIDVLKPESDS